MELNLKNSKLYSALQAKEPEFAVSVYLCWEEAEKLLRHASATNPCHTSHGPDHALALVDILDQIVGPISTNLNLSPDELYILLSATLLHDIGMVAGINGSESYRNQIRSEHHIRTHTYIRTKWQELKLKHEFVDIVADVAAAHRKLNIKKDIKDYPVGNASPRAKLCASLLRLADECHITRCSSFFCNVREAR